MAAKPLTPDRTASFWRALPLLAAGVILIAWLLNTPPGLLGKADAVGYAVCHRIELRSFHLGERPLPLCARCSGMYLGAFAGLAWQALGGLRRAGMPGRAVWLALGGWFALFALDSVNSYLHLSPLMEALPFLPRLYEPNNTLRLLTGLGAGLGIAALLYPAFAQTAWQAMDARPAMNGLGGLAAMSAASLALAAPLLTGIPLLLYPLALLSAATVLLVLTLVYGMALILLSRRENTAQTFGQLWPFLVGGFAMALAQIALFDLGRYWLTGTWHGFTFG